MQLHKWLGPLDLMIFFRSKIQKAMDKINFNDLMNVNSGSNTLLNQPSGNNTRLMGPPAPPPLPPSMSGALYSNQQIATKLNPNAPDFMRGQTPATDFARAPGPVNASNLGRNIATGSSS